MGQEPASTFFSHVKAGDTPYKGGGLRDFFLYRDLGIAGATKGKVIAHLVKANMPPTDKTKEQIWDFLQQQGFLRGPLEIYGEMELLRLLDQFFDRAVCYVAEGYETAKMETQRGK